MLERNQNEHSGESPVALPQDILLTSLRLVSDLFIDLLCAFYGRFIGNFIYRMDTTSQLRSSYILFAYWSTCLF